MTEDQAAAYLTGQDDDWLHALDHIPLLCERCRGNLRDEGSANVLLPCGVCDALVCAQCRRIWSAMGPCVDEHHACGMMGHLTLSEQPKFPVAVKRSA